MGYSNQSKSKTRWLSHLVFCVVVCLATLSFSTRLADATNIVRFTLWSIALLLVTVASFFTSSKKQLLDSVPINIGTISLAIFVVWQAATVLWAPNKAEALYDLSKWVLFLLTLLFVYNYARRSFGRFVVIMSIVSLIVFVISLAVAIWQMTGLDNLAWHSRYSIVSLFAHKGTYSIMLLFMMAFPIMRLMLFKGRRRIVYWALIVAESAIIVFLQARAAWVAGIAVLVAALLLWLCSVARFKQRWYWTLILAALVGLMVVGGSRLFVATTLPTPDQSGGLAAKASINERHALWTITYRMIDEHPVLGCGVGNWKVCYPAVGTEDAFSIDVLDFNFVRPHNDYLRVLSESGYIGLALLLVAIASLLVSAASVRRGTRHGMVARIASAFFVGVMAFAFFDFPFDRTEVMLWVAILAATVIAATPHQTSLKAGLPFKIVAIVLLIPVVLLGVSRWSSESHFGPVVGGIHSRQWGMVERHCREARTPFYNLSPLGMPIAYYEAMAREQQGKPAIETFMQALSDSPWCKEVLSDIGRLEYTERHATEVSITLLEEAIRISPNYTRAYLNLAQLYVQEQRYEEAINTLQRLDLDKKEASIRRMVWHYHEGATARYYYYELIPIERKAVSSIKDYAEGMQQTIVAD